MSSDFQVTSSSVCGAIDGCLLGGRGSGLRHPQRFPSNNHILANFWSHWAIQKLLSLGLQSAANVKWFYSHQQHWFWSNWWLLVWGAKVSWYPHITCWTKLLDRASCNINQPYEGKRMSSQNVQFIIYCS